MFGTVGISTIPWRIMKLVPPCLLEITVDTFFSADRAPLSIPSVPHAWIPLSTKGGRLHSSSACSSL